VGRVLTQHSGLANTVDSDSARKPIVSPRRYTGQSIFEDRRLRGSDAERTRASQKGSRSGLPLQVLALGDHTVDALLEEILDSRRDQHL
jgi:hypothetical protein